MEGSKSLGQSGCHQLAAVAYGVWPILALPSLTQVRRDRGRAWAVSPRALCSLASNSALADQPCVASSSQATDLCSCLGAFLLSFVTLGCRHTRASDALELAGLAPCPQAG